MDKIEKELKDQSNNTLNTLKVGKWIPEYCLVRCEEGWKKPNELNKKEKLIIVENGIIKAVLPKAYNKMEYKGKMLGFGKILFKPSDKLIEETDKWFTTKTWIKEEYYETNSINYSGTLYSFDINPVISYVYKVSKINNDNILKLDYIL